MKITVKAAAAFYTQDGIVADTAQNPKLASYDARLDDKTYNLYITSEYTPAGV